MDHYIEGQWFQFASQLGMLAKGAAVLYVALFLLIAAAFGVLSLTEKKKE